MLNPIIKEDLLYYLWKTKSFDLSGLKTTDGKLIEVIDFGNQNYDSGPDFSNAKIKIDETIWAGNVEMHVYASDWEKHSHDVDKAYDNVILHVVFDYDKDVYTTTEHLIPCVELKDRIDKTLISSYTRLINNNLWIPCERSIAQVDELTISFWMQRLIIERLESKVKYLNTILGIKENDWEETLYIALMRYMGAKVNTEPFENLAKKLPYKLILKNKDNLQHIEALLYGQAGMLLAEYEDEYFQQLKQDYSFLSKKYSLTSISPVAWKFARMRPAGFPTVRIAQVAQILFHEQHLFSKIKEIEDIKVLRSLFEVTPSAYWEEHYRFGKSSTKKPKKLSNAFIDVLIINVIAPILFLYGKQVGDESFKEKAISHLEQIKAEKNKIIDKFKSLDINAKSAADSQALIQLKKAYCDEKRCMSCAIGNRIIKS